MRICLISPEASRDLDKIFDYFASHNVEAGEKFVLAFEKKCEKLLQFPKFRISFLKIIIYPISSAIAQHHPKDDHAVPEDIL